MKHFWMFYYNPDVYTTIDNCCQHVGLSDGWWRSLLLPHCRYFYLFPGSTSVLRCHFHPLPSFSSICCTLCPTVDSVVVVEAVADSLGTYWSLYHAWQWQMQDNTPGQGTSPDAALSSISGSHCTHYRHQWVPRALARWWPTPPDLLGAGTVLGVEVANTGQCFEGWHFTSFATSARKVGAMGKFSFSPSTFLFCHP